MKTTASALSDRGLRREGNEDQYLIDESLGLYVVCDGMGGHAAGEIASGRAIEFAAEHISDHADAIDSASDSPDGFYRVLKIAEEAIQHASQKLYRLASSTSKYAGMGTTMTLLIIVQNKAIMAHVGDSRLYLLRAGEIHQLSVDHTLANEMFLAGGLTAEQAVTSRYQHVLTRSIGPHQSVVVDTLLFDLVTGDRFLLCSDGLSNYFNDPAVVAEFLAEPKIVEQPGKLIEFAKQSGGADNITAIVVQTLADSDDKPAIDTQARLDCLRSTFLCRKLPVNRLMHVLSIATTIQCTGGQELLSRDDKCNGLYLVLEGRFRIVDDDVVEAELAPGDCFGEASLIAPAKSPATLIATEPSRVLMIGGKSFNRLTRRLPRLGNALLRNLSRHLSQRIGDIESDNPIHLHDTGPL